MGHVPLLREAAAQLAHTFSLGGPS